MKILIQAMVIHLVRVNKIMMKITILFSNSGENPLWKNKTTIPPTSTAWTCKRSLKCLTPCPTKGGTKTAIYISSPHPIKTV
jgi:hypothetical protein